MIRKTALPGDVSRRLDSVGSALAHCPGVLFGYVFGSAASDRLTPLSDVDIAVYVDDSVDPGEAWFEAIRTVTRHLGTDEVDVVLLNAAPTALVGRILQTRRVVYDRDPLRRHQFESQALRDFFDFRVFEQRLLARRIRRG
jgi:predicted nucleotidyltransferase